MHGAQELLPRCPAPEVAEEQPCLQHSLDPAAGGRAASLDKTSRHAERAAIGLPVPGQPFSLGTLELAR